MYPTVYLDSRTTQEIEYIETDNNKKRKINKISDTIIVVEEENENNKQSK